ncbi:Uncharacterised protein [uncultured archaeon]|nr:Uncharacterised protein [uncultured archaeon]
MSIEKGDFVKIRECERYVGQCTRVWPMISRIQIHWLNVCSPNKIYVEYYFEKLSKEKAMELLLL